MAFSYKSRRRLSREEVLEKPNRNRKGLKGLKGRPFPTHPPSQSPRRTGLGHCAPPPRGGSINLPMARSARPLSKDHIQ